MLKTMEPKYRKNLLHLRSTEEVQNRLSALHRQRDETGQDPSNLEFWTDQLNRCQERDRFQLERPVGCWCFGLGEDGSRCCDFCPEGQLALERHQETKRKLREDRAWTRWEHIPSRFYDWCLATSPHRAIADRLQASIDAIDICSWMFTGSYGTGKTGLAIGYARGVAFERGWSILFCSVPDLLAELRATYSKRDDDVTEEEVITKYTDVNLLVLDDLGAEQVKNQEWVADRLYQIIGKRHAGEQATVFTSNLSVAQVAEKIGERITWRIVEMCGPDNIIEITGPNLRDHATRQ